MDQANDNAPPPPSAVARRVPIIGFVSGDGDVTITDATWKPAPGPATMTALFPNDAREA